MSWTMRRAAPDDVDILYSIHRAAYKDQVSQIWGWDEKFQHEMFHDKYDYRKVEVIMLDEEAVGYLSADRRDDLIFIDFSGPGVL